jgi:hypothetical protein
LALTIPRDALILRQSGQYVYRISDENRAERIYVDIGGSQGALIAVTGSLHEGDTIAIRGAESLTDGAEVQVVISFSASESDDINEG